MQSATSGNTTAEDVPPVHGSFQFHDCRLVSRVIILPTVQVQVDDAQSRSSGPTCGAQQGYAYNLDDPEIRLETSRQLASKVSINAFLQQMLSCAIQFPLSAPTPRPRRPLRPGRPVIRLGSTSFFSSNVCSTLSSNRSAIICDYKANPARSSSPFSHLNVILAAWLSTLPRY